MLIAYAHKLGLWQADFFALCEMRPGKADRWLHPVIKVARYGIQESSKVIMKIKFFKRPKHLVDPIAVRLFYLQIKTNVVSGAYPCADRLAIRLAAYQVSHPIPLQVVVYWSWIPIALCCAAHAQLQIQEGDHQPQKHKPGWFGGTDHLQQFVPPEVVFKYPVDYIEERIFRLHAKLIGKNDQAPPSTPFLPTES